MLRKNHISTDTRGRRRQPTRKEVLKLAGALLQGSCVIALVGVAGYALLAVVMMSI